MSSEPYEQIEAEQLVPAVGAARRRAWASVAAVTAGAVAARAMPEVSLVWWALAAAASAHVWRFGAPRHIGKSLLLVLFFLAGGWFVLRTSTIPLASLDLIDPGSGRSLMVVRGGVQSRPEAPRAGQDVLARFRRSAGGVAFDLEVDAVELDNSAWQPAHGRVRVVVRGVHRASDLALVPGEVVRVKGWYTPPSGRRNPGDPDRLRWAHMTGQAGMISTSSPDLVTRVESDVAGWMSTVYSTVFAKVSAARHWCIATILGDGSHPRGRGILAALLLGERDPAIAQTRTAFQRTGTAHLLAISGFHLVVLVALGMMLMRLTGDHGRWESVVLVVLVLGLLVIVPARVPIVRAGVLVLLLLVAEMSGRRYDRLTVLGWISIGLFIWRPMDVFSLGAQLSIGMTAFLLWISGFSHPWIVPVRLRGLRPGRLPAWKRRLRWLRGWCVVCVFAWALSLPVVMYHTGVAALSGAVTTALATVPIVVLLALGYLAMLMAVIAPPVGIGFLGALATMSDALAQGVQAVAAIPGAAIDIIPPSLPWTIAAVLTVLVYIRRARVLAPGPIAAAFVLAGWVGYSNLLPRSLPAGVVLQMDMLDVGDGSCVIVRSGTHAMLWDCGSLERDVRPILERARKSLGITNMDAGFVTHANFDHYGSMPDAADVFRLKRLLISPHVFEQDSEQVDAFLAEMTSRGVDLRPVEAGFQLTLGKVDVNLLWPTTAAQGMADNDQSLVARLDVPTRSGRRSLLLTGDIEEPAMRVLLQQPEQMKADILEVPHHGSFKPEAQRFVAAVGAKVIGQSTGWSRVDDPRWSGQRERSVWLTTASQGAITVRVMNDGSVQVSTMR